LRYLRLKNVQSTNAAANTHV